MVAAAKKQTMGFQTEAKQLLKLMIHSLYSNKEIFLRELISNASDAVDKLRFETLTNAELLADDPDLKIRISFDEKAKTLTIEDNGVGMSREEVIDNLGTIAKSGTAEFLSKLTGDEKKDSQLIGQFGVGFYSAFIVAKKVEVITRRAGTEKDQAVRWISSGEADFSVENAKRDKRGTTVILHLNKEGEEFANAYRLRAIVKKYSDHISLPVVMEKQPMPEYDDEGNVKEVDATQAAEDEVVNEAKALWTRSRSDIKDEEYQEFYKHISHDFQDAVVWAHNKVEGKLEYNSLLYVPQKAPFDLWHREAARGLKLYVQRTFIMDDAEQFLPMYLRFIKGIVDSNDLPLNVSREILQGNKTTENMRNALTKRVLEMLGKMAKKSPEKYSAFWKEFGQVLKEGPGEDFANKEDVAKLLRFSTTHTDNNEQSESLTDYISRMPEGSQNIYYIVAESFNTAKHSPQLEVFRKKGIEVVLLSDRIDEWLMSHLREFDGKKLKDVSKGALDLGELENAEEKKEQEELNKDFATLVERISKVLEDKVNTVRVTHRLTESPACLVVGEYDMGAQMRKIMEQAGQPVPEVKPIFEINPKHPLLERLDKEVDEDRFADLTKVLFDQAYLAEGAPLEDSAEYVRRINKLLLELSV